MSKFRGSITLSIFSLSTLSNYHYWQSPKTRYWRLVRPYQTGIPPARLLALIWAHNFDLSLTSLYLIQPEKYSWLILKLAGRKQLATQGVSGRQVHKGVAGVRQRRGRVASPVGIWSGLKIGGKSLAVCKTPPAGRNAPAPPVYSCALTP